MNCTCISTPLPPELEWRKAPDPFAMPTTQPEEPLGPLRVNGRYVLPDPVTGEMRTWQSVTNQVRALEDAYMLQAWSERRVAWGLAQRPGLTAYAASLTLEDCDKGELTRVAEEAKEAAGAHEGALQGSALHRWTERLDAGDVELEDVAPAAFADVEAYERATWHAQLLASPDLIERTICVPEYGTAGTFDRLLAWTGTNSGRPCMICGPGVLYVGDLKTGKHEVTYGQMKTTMQLTDYAMGADRWLLDKRTRRWIEAERRVCQHVAIVMHLPVGSATCTLYRVDLVRGAALLALAADVLEARRTSRNTWEAL